MSLELSDEDLLISLAEGENNALDVLFSRHSGRVLSYCAKRGLSPEQSQDVVQIVFLQIFRKKHLYNPAHPALAWIYVITRSELKDERHRELRHRAESADFLSQIAAPDPITYEDRDEVQALLAELKPHEQEALKLRYLDELEYEEIAQKLQQSESSIRQIVSRGLKFLRSKHERR